MLSPNEAEQEFAAVSRRAEAAGAVKIYNDALEHNEQLFKETEQKIKHFLDLFLEFVTQAKLDYECRGQWCYVIRREGKTPVVIDVFSQGYNVKCESVRGIALCSTLPELAETLGRYA